MKIRSYAELKELQTFDERFEYLKLTGTVGQSTFGFDRYLNQILYSSSRWKRTRDIVIIRDNACDLGLIDYPINGRVIVHHMNPISIEDVEQERESIINPEFLICVSHITHEAIHFGDKSLLPELPIERYSGDTTPWNSRFKKIKRR